MDWMNFLMYAFLILLLTFSCVMVLRSAQDMSYSYKLYCSHAYDSCSCEVSNYPYNDGFCVSALRELGYARPVVVE
jgi:hypothetical protein